MQILRRDSAPMRDLGDEERYYYQSDQLRMVITHIPAGHVQNEHRHESLYDTTYVLEGEVEVSERVGDKLRIEQLQAGDMVACAPGTYHNVANRSDRPAKLLTLKYLKLDELSGQAFADLCERDWVGLPAESRP